MLVDRFLEEVERRVDPYVDPREIEWASWQKKLLALYRAQHPFLVGPVNPVVCEAFSTGDLERQVQQRLAVEVVEALATSKRGIVGLVEPLLGQSSILTLAGAVINGLDLPAMALWGGGQAAVEGFLRARGSGPPPQLVIRKVLVAVAMLRLARLMRTDDDALLGALGMPRIELQRMRHEERKRMTPGHSPFRSPEEASAPPAGEP